MLSLIFLVLEKFYTESMVPPFFTHIRFYEKDTHEHLHKKRSLLTQTMIFHLSFTVCRRDLISWYSWSCVFTDVFFTKLVCY